jgi:hypothetical protein
MTAPMTAVHYVLLAAEIALGLFAAWSVIVILGACMAGGQADDDSARVAREEGWR